MKTVIKNRYTEKTIVESELTLIGTVVANKANLCSANLCSADLCSANLRDANLRDADLYGATLRGANLYGANLYGADLRGANLSGADLSGADLRDANLRGANLYGADLSGANLYGAGKIVALKNYMGLYHYQVQAVLAKDGTRWVRMGCLFYTLEDWEKIGIRNSNTSEFPNDGSDKCEERVRAFEFAKTAALNLKGK